MSDENVVIHAIHERLEDEGPMTIDDFLSMAAHVASLVGVDEDKVLAKMREEWGDDFTIAVTPRPGR